VEWRAGEKLCAFVSDLGGRVCLSVPPQGEIAGQSSAAVPLRELAALVARLSRRGSRGHEAHSISDFGFRI